MDWSWTGPVFAGLSFVVLVWTVVCITGGADPLTGRPLGEPAPEKKKKVKAVGKEPELDFSAKRKRVEAEHKMWDRDFLAGLGADLETFVGQWRGDGKRVELGRRLKAAQDLAELEGRHGDVVALQTQRYYLSKNPERELPAGQVWYVENYLHEVERDRAKAL